MIPMMQEVTAIMKMGELLYHVPTAPEPWIEPADYDSDCGMGQLDDVVLKIAGMPLRWKFLNSIIILLPKCLLWKLTCETGVTFLMETAGIQDIIINSVGLTFIVGLDELICDALMSEETKNFLEKLEDFPLYDVKTSCVGDMSLLSEDEILQKHNEHKLLRTWSMVDFGFLLPSKLAASTILTLFFLWQYYFKFCKTSDEGRQVSIDMFLPTSVQFTWGQAFFPAVFKIQVDGEPYWTMPKIVH